MGKRTSEFMRSVHLRTIQSDLQQGRSMAEAEQMVDTACKKMLANQIMESYHFELTEA